MITKVKKSGVLMLLTAALCLTITAPPAEATTQGQEGHGPVTLTHD